MNKKTILLTIAVIVPLLLMTVVLWPTIQLQRSGTSIALEAKSWDNIARNDTPHFQLPFERPSIDTLDDALIQQLQTNEETIAYVTFTNDPIASVDRVTLTRPDGGPYLQVKLSFYGDRDEPFERQWKDGLYYVTSNVATALDTVVPYEQDVPVDATAEEMPYHWKVTLHYAEGRGVLTAVEPLDHSSRP